ncbi:MAG: hypothetical protein EBY15_06505 [Gammaproteobacteria bacterium]|nr:hypothetical protein [Gammaproteobacteria bacterium]
MTSKRPSFKKDPFIRRWSCLLVTIFHLEVGLAADRPYPDVSSDMEHLLARQRMEKRDLLKEVLALTPEEERKFWPLYYGYQAQLITLWDRRLSLVEAYRARYPHLEKAWLDTMIKASLRLDQDEGALLEKTYGVFKRSFSIPLAAQLIQFERTFNSSYTSKIESNLPLIPKN